MSEDINKLLRAVISTTQDVAVFLPSDNQRACKSQFWTRIAESGIQLPPELDLATASRYTSDPRIQAWWSAPNFSQWFSNSQEFRERMEFLANIAIDELQSLIQSAGTQASAKTAAIKMVMEIAGKMPKQKADAESEDDVIARMSKTELEEYISKKMPVLVRASSTPSEAENASPKKSK